MARKWTQDEILRYQREEAKRPRIHAPLPPPREASPVPDIPTGGTVIILNYSEPDGLDSLSGFVVQ
jgi:hypothetical protein